MDKIRKLLESTNFDDKFIGLHLLDGLSEEDFNSWIKANCRKGDSQSELDGWHHCTYILEFAKRINNPKGYNADIYKKGKYGYYFLAGHAMTIDNEKDAQFWITERNFGCIDL